MYTKRQGTRSRYGQENSAHARNGSMNDATITALANFATSKASDRAALSKLTDTVQELTAEVNAARGKIDQLQQQLAQEKRETKRDGKVKTDPNTTLFYCWTHGFSCDHPSRRCLDKADGYKD